MDQIFANPGFKHIAEKIIASMDSKSLVNFKQASKTIANHFRSYKTCMSFFERTLNESISQGKIWEYNFLNHLPVLTSENKEREEIMYFVECCHLNQYDCPHQHRNIPKGTVFEDLLLLHNQKQKIQIEKVCAMYKMIDKFRTHSKISPNTIDDMRIVKRHLIPKIVDTYKNFEECPLVLAMESTQDGLFELMLENGMLKICQCTNQVSIFQFANNYLSNFAELILKSDLLPIDQKVFQKTLEVIQRKRKCHEIEKYVLVDKSQATKIDQIKRQNGKNSIAIPNSKRSRMDPIYHDKTECVLAKDLKLLESY